jgi:GNAT superfamily N-acetyltransferase
MSYNGQSGIDFKRRDLPMLSIRPATIHDVPLLNTLVHELAEYDRVSHEAVVSEEDLARDGFGDRPKFRAVIAEWSGEPAGYVLFFEFYSTFQGRAGLFLDDIFVRPAFRKRGIGRALLDHVAKIAWNEKYFCLRWEVLDWNTPAIEFYRRLGAVFLDEWKSVCLIGDALQSAAQQPFSEGK